MNECATECVQSNHLGRHEADLLVTIWDTPGPPPEGPGRVLLWDGWDEAESRRSLLRLVDEGGDPLRRRYLRWIRDLGETEVGRRRVVECLEVGRGGLSFWWLTAIAQKNVWRSPAVLDVLKMMAIEELVVDEGVTDLVLVSRSRTRRRSMRDLCKTYDINYVGKQPNRSIGCTSSVQSTWNRMPPTLRAVVELIRSVKRSRSFRSSASSPDIHQGATIFVCSNFLNLDMKAAENGVFRSHYWGRLNEVLTDVGSVNWLHLFMPSPSIGDSREAQTLANRFNQRSPTSGRHSFHESYISPAVLVRVAATWLKLVVARVRLFRLGRLIRKDGGKEWLWTLVRFDMRESLAGPSMVQNLLTVELVDRALADLPFQAVGFYLAEGRPEERALAHAWGKHGHGKLIAVVHATIAYWDLRYHFDPLVVTDTSEYRMPMGELTAVNGPAAREALLSSGLPSEKLVEVEALRYEYLTGIRAQQGSGNTNNSVRIVVIGEYRGPVTDQMLKTLESAVVENQLDVKCRFKPHPNYSVDAEKWQSIGLEVIDQPLRSLLDQVDLAVASSGSSAVVDAYMAGVPVAVYRPPDELPLTDLLGRDGVFIAATERDMLNAITNGVGVKLAAREPTEFFCLDSDLSKWRRLLVDSLHEVSPT